MAASNVYRHLRSIALHGRSTKQRLAALSAMAKNGIGPSERLLDELLADPDLPAKITLWIATYRTSERSKEEDTARRLKLRKELGNL